MIDRESNDPETAAKLARDEEVPDWPEIPDAADLVDDYIDLELVKKYTIPVEPADFLPEGTPPCDDDDTDHPF